MIRRNQMAMYIRSLGFVMQLARIGDDTRANSPLANGFGFKQMAAHSLLLAHGVSTQWDEMAPSIGMLGVAKTISRARSRQYLSPK